MKIPIFPGDILIHKAYGTTWKCITNQDNYSVYECVRGSKDYPIGFKSKSYVKSYYDGHNKMTFNLIRNSKASKILYDNGDSE